MTFNRRPWCAATVLALCVTAAPAEESPWEVRVRAVHVSFANKDTTAPVNLGLNIDSKTVPDVSWGYYWTPNIATELQIGVPYTVKVKQGATAAGSYKGDPVTMLMRYHWTQFDGFRPYVGLGYNRTRFLDVDLQGAQTNTASKGKVVQVGVDVPVSEHLSINLDWKRIDAHNDITYPMYTSGRMTTDPSMLGLGLAYRF